MISFRGWQSVDINFFKMFRSCLFKRFLIKTGNEIKRRLWHRSKKFCITIKVGTHRRQVAATRWGDTSQRQIASCVLENFEKMFVAATEFCRRNKSHRFSLIWFFATCCSDKIPLRRQRFSQRFSSTHEAISRCDVSPHRVAATCCPICSHGVICRCDVLLQLVA